MKNILKGQLYMLPKYGISHFVFIGIVLVQILGTWANTKTYSDLIPNAGIFAAMNVNPTYMISVLYLFVLIAQMCLGDFGDKTSYYEIMGGHTRLQVFLGRVVPSLALGVLGAWVLFLVPDITAAVMLGWGSDIPVGQIIIRRLLVILPLLRLGCEFVLFSYLVKNMIAVMAAGFMVYMAGWSLSMNVSSPWLGMTSIPMLYNTDIWTTYGLDSEIHFSFGASLQADTVVPVAVFSLAAAAISLYMGYLFFRKDDMN